MRICIVSNSHLASLKLGWDAIRTRFPEIEIVFFGSPAGSIHRTRLINGKLASETPEVRQSFMLTSGGSAEIDPQDFDTFLFYGLSLLVPRLEFGISKAVRQLVARSIASASMALKMAKDVRSVSEKPIWLGHVPLPSLPLKTAESRVMTAYEASVATLDAVINLPQTMLLRQPPETLNDELTTLTQYSIGAVKLLSMYEAGGHKLFRHDTKHMNGDFGAMWLEMNLPVMLAASVPQA